MVGRQQATSALTHTQSSTVTQERHKTHAPVTSWKLPFPNTILLSGTLVGTTRVLATDHPGSVCTSEAASATSFSAEGI